MTDSGNSGNDSGANRIRSTMQDFELDDLRSKALSSEGLASDHKKEIENLIKASSRIHAAFLFHSPKTLQPVLRAIGETNSGSIETGWQMFGDKLGLDVNILKVINNNQFNHEDPVYNTLLHYVQYEDATIGKIIQALSEMERFDVIMRTKQILGELAEVILNHERELLQSSRLHSDHALESPDGSRQPGAGKILLKPALIPDAPFIIKNVQSAPLLSTLLLQNVTSSRHSVVCSPSFSQALAIEMSPSQLCSSSEVHISPEILTNSSRSSSSPNSNSPRFSPAVSVAPSSKKSYARKVMLTFTADGAAVAQEVARSLRRPRGSQSIGVLILGEQIDHIRTDPNLFILASFHLVDYVMPILTEGYLRTILRKDIIDRTQCVDAGFVPLIYQTMMQDYSRRGCLNIKVRSLIPDRQLPAIQEHLMMACPIFAAWDPVSQIETVAERLLRPRAKTWSQSSRTKNKSQNSENEAESNRQSSRSGYDIQSFKTDSEGQKTKSDTESSKQCSLIEQSLKTSSGSEEAETDFGGQACKSETEARKTKQGENQALVTGSNEQKPKNSGIGAGRSSSGSSASARSNTKSKKKVASDTPVSSRGKTGSAKSMPMPS